MTLQEIDDIFEEYRIELDQECMKWFYRWKFDKRAMMLWWASEMLLFLEKRWLLLPNTK